MSWLTSLNSAVVISSIALVSFIGYALLIYRYVIDEIMPGIPGAAIQTSFVLLLVGAWIWSLHAAASGSKGGLIGALVCTSLSALFTLYDLAFHSPVRYGWPLVQISIWTTFVVCLISIALLAIRISVFS